MGHELSSQSYLLTSARMFHGAQDLHLSRDQVSVQLGRDKNICCLATINYDCMQSAFN
jgi:hypothetical protein